MNDIKKKNKIKNLPINYKYPNKSIISKKFMFIILILIISLIKHILLKRLRKLNSITEIIITIQGTGNQKILSDESSVQSPDEILVNGESQSELGKIVYNLENSKNNITMRWNDISLNFANMFKNLKNITDIYFTNIDTSEVTDMSYMFSKTSIQSLDLSAFNTSSVENFGDMFRECGLLTSLNLSNFKTSLCKSIRGMFHSCNLLQKLDISNFDTSLVTNMKSLFFNCYSLEKIDLRHFDVSLVTNMNGMFYGCKKLTTLDLSNFRTPSLLDLGNFLEKCSGLKYLNIDNFDTSKTTNFHVMFNGCSSLISLNLNSFNSSSYAYGHDYFQGLNENIIFTIDVNKTSEIFTINSNPLTIDKENICFENSSKLIVEKANCTLDCKTDNQYQYEFDNLCYEECPEDSHVISYNHYLCIKNPKNYYLDIDNDIYKPCFSKCDGCYGEGNEDNNNCIQCKSDYAFIPEKIYKNNCYQKCNNYYYFDNLKQFYCTSEKKCPDNYNKLIEKKNKCIDYCKNDDTYKYEYNNTCYNSEDYDLDSETGTDINTSSQDRCQYYFYIDSNGNYHCTQNNECPDEYSKLIISKNKCIDNCINDDIFKYDKNDICIKLSKNEESIIVCPIYLPFEKNLECVEICSVLEFLSQECNLNNKNNKTAQDNIINDIKNEIKKGENGDLNSILSNVRKNTKKDFLKEDSDTIYQITSSYHQNNIEYDNISTIILGDCEKKLKQHYDIDEDETLIIFKVDIFEEGLLIPIIEYEIYHPITLEKLNLSYCENTQIELKIPVKINEDYLFQYNSSHDYYNDICYTYTTENGTDIVVKDRQIEYVNNNLSLCEANCEYNNYDSNKKKSICKCNPKVEMQSINDIENNNNKLLKAFKDLKDSINLNIMKCFKILFSKEGLINNIGNYIISCIILSHIISTILFKVKGYKIICNMVDYIVKKNFNNFNKVNNEKKDISLHDKNSVNENIYNKEKKKIKKKKKIVKREKSKIINNPQINNPLKRKRNSKIIIEEEEFTSSKKEKRIDSKRSEGVIIFPRKNMLRVSNYEDNNNNNYNPNNNIKELETKNNINYNDYELNRLLYEEALVIDKRTYFQYYFSLLKEKQLVIFTFYTYNDYNSRIIKIFLFFFSFALYYTINALFFNYTTMHQIYEDEGLFNFIFQLPQILYSTIISSVINMIVKTLSLSQKDIIEIKNDKNNIEQKATKTLKCLIIKFLIFFILSFLFLIFFWYYLSCFCAVYNNTQHHLIKDTIFSFILSLLYPFLLNFLPGIFRIPSLKAKNRDKQVMYKFSQIVQII